MKKGLVAAMAAFSGYLLWPIPPPPPPPPPTKEEIEPPLIIIPLTDEDRLLAERERIEDDAERREEARRVEERNRKESERIAAYRAQEAAQEAAKEAAQDKETLAEIKSLLSECQRKKRAGTLVKCERTINSDYFWKSHPLMQSYERLMANGTLPPDVVFRFSEIVESTTDDFDGYEYDYDEVVGSRVKITIYRV